MQFIFQFICFVAVIMTIIFIMNVIVAKFKKKPDLVGVNLKKTMLSILVVLGSWFMYAITSYEFEDDSPVAATNDSESLVTTTSESYNDVSSEQIEETEDSIPTEFKNALDQAESYSDLMHLSKIRIFEQLTSEVGGQFPDEAAQYAIDNMVVDWNENALKQAESYSDLMHLSKAGLYDQLTSEAGGMFEPDEAQYAIDNIQVDWNENALKQAESYQEIMSLSKEAIRDQLVSPAGGQFTPEEADYAVSNLQ